MIKDKNIDTIIKDEIFSAINPSNYSKFNIRLLMSKVGVLFDWRANDYRLKCYEFLKVLQEKNVPGIEQLENLRYENSYIKFENDGTAYDFTCFENVLSGASSKKTSFIVGSIAVCAVYNLDGLPDYIDTGVREWARIPGDCWGDLRGMQSLYYFPTRPLQQEYISEDVVEQYSGLKCCFKDNVIIEDRMVKDLLDVLPDAKMKYEPVKINNLRARTDIEYITKYSNGNLDELIGKYAIVPCLVSIDMIEKLQNSKKKCGCTLRWNNGKTIEC